MMAHSNFPQFIWTPRRVAAKFILTFSEKPYDPTLLPSLIARLGNVIDHQLGGDESNRTYARKATMYLIALYPAALAPLSEALCQCLHLIAFTSGFLGRATVRHPDLLEQLVKARNRLSVATCANDIIVQKHFRVNPTPAAFRAAIAATDAILLASCQALNDGSVQDVGLLGPASCMRDAQRAVLRAEASASKEPEGRDPAWSAWFILQKTHLPLARFGELKYFFDTLRRHHQSEIAEMLREVETPRPASSKSAAKHGRKVIATKRK